MSTSCRRWRRCICDHVLSKKKEMNLMSISCVVRSYTVKGRKSHEHFARCLFCSPQVNDGAGKVHLWSRSVKEKGNQSDEHSCAVRSYTVGEKKKSNAHFARCQFCFPQDDDGAGTDTDLNEAVSDLVSDSPRMCDGRVTCPSHQPAWCGTSFRSRRQCEAVMILWYTSNVWWRGRLKHPLSTAFKTAMKIEEGRIHEYMTDVSFVNIIGLRSVVQV